MNVPIDNRDLNYEEIFKFYSILYEWIKNPDIICNSDNFRIDKYGYDSLGLYEKDKVFIARAKYTIVLECINIDTTSLIFLSHEEIIDAIEDSNGDVLYFKLLYNKKHSFKNYFLNFDHTTTGTIGFLSIDKIISLFSLSLKGESI